MQMNVYTENQTDKKFGIGFQLYDLDGQKLKDRSAKEIYENEGGYIKSRMVYFDGNMKSTGARPLTLIMTTFDPNVEAKFRFTVFYKHRQGSVDIRPIN